MKTKRFVWLYVLAALVILFGLVQIVPYGRNHSNPPVVNSPTWDSTQTTALVKAACMDCHSNETIWPWYSDIAPMSWLIQSDVDEGRARFNMSTWPTNAAAQQGLVAEMVRIIQEGEMPPMQYTLIHANARLSAAQQQELIQGLQASVNK